MLFLHCSNDIHGRLRTFCFLMIISITRKLSLLSGEKVLTRRMFPVFLFNNLPLLSLLSSFRYARFSLKFM